MSTRARLTRRSGEMFEGYFSGVPGPCPGTAGPDLGAEPGGRSQDESIIALCSTAKLACFWQNKCPNLDEMSAVFLLP